MRGVAVNPNIVKTLLERNWIRVVGQRDVPGHPELLGTTREFLDYFGLKTLDELPPLAQLTAMADINLQLDLGEDARAQSWRPMRHAAASRLDDDSARGGRARGRARPQRSELVAAGADLDR